MCARAWPRFAVGPDSSDRSVSAGLRARGPRGRAAAKRQINNTRPSRARGRCVRAPQRRTRGPLDG